MHLILSVALVDSACSWHWPLGASSYWPRVSRVPANLEVKLQPLPRKLGGLGIVREEGEEVLAQDEARR